MNFKSKEKWPLFRHWGSVQAVQRIGGVDVQLYSFLTTALVGVGGQCQALAALYPREIPGTHYKVGWVGSQDRSGHVRKIPSPSEFDPRTVKRVVSRYTDWATRSTS